MSSSSASSTSQPAKRSRGRCCGGRRNGSNWSGANIATMVLGFVLFWPIGLFVLWWIMIGRDVRDIPQWFYQQWTWVTGMRNGNLSFVEGGNSDNVVFNEFQQTQHDRIREIKEEIKARAHRFTDFRADVKRRADEEEFNRFMADKPTAADV